MYDPQNDTDQYMYEMDMGGELYIDVEADEYALYVPEDNSIFPDMYCIDSGNLDEYADRGEDEFFAWCNEKIRRYLERNNRA